MDLIINWISTNKEWVFSGVGIMIIGLIIKFFFNSSKKSSTNKEAKSRSVYINGNVKGGVFTGDKVHKE